MFLFAREKYPVAQGKNREPGLQENPVRDFTGRRVLLGEPYKKPRESVVFYWQKYLFPGLRPVFFRLSFPADMLE